MDTMDNWLCPPSQALIGCSPLVYRCFTTDVFLDKMTKMECPVLSGGLTLS